MPKEGKSSTNSFHRSTPYPTTITRTIAPSSPMATQATLPIQSAGADRHASQSWPPEKDQLLMRARQQGLNWQPIASQYFPDKTANACRKRHERLMEKQHNNNSWDGVKVEALAEAYLKVREQMWKLLADQVGEKWQTVEAKCMEKGLKTLQAAGRTASRRQRQPAFGGSDGEYDEITDSRYPPPSRDRSTSHQDEGDEGFNDSALCTEADHPSLAGVQCDQHRSYSSTTHNEQPPYTGGTVTPPYSSVRSFSISSSTGFTPNNTAAQQYSPPSVHYQHQTLPSFSSTFNVPSIPSISSVIPHSYSPHQHTAVTTR